MTTSKRKTSNEAKSKNTGYQTSYLVEQSIDFNEASLQNTKNSYFIQVHTSNLYDYFSSGLIIPASYINNRTCEDTQSTFNTCLLIANGYVEDFDNTQCLLEISLKSDEVNSNDNIFLLNKPLPISRIKKVIVLNNNTKEKIISTALSQDVGFIPEELFSLFNDSIKRVEKSQIELIAEQSFERELDIFDKLLGLFAFIKNQQLYYYKSRNIISNYSEHFLEALSIINKEVEIQYSNIIKTEFTKAYSILFDFNNQDVNQPIGFTIKHIYDNGLIDKDFIDNFFGIFSKLANDKKNNIDELKSILLSPIGKKNSLKGLYEINSFFYKVAYLYIYGKKGSNDKEILKNLISEELYFSQSEITLALLGMYYGYKQLRLTEPIDFNDSFIENKFGTDFNIKFKLDNKLDYIILESLYEYVFNKTKADKNVLSFNPLLKNKLSTPKIVNKDIEFEVISEKVVFDSSFYQVKILNDFDIVSKLLINFPEKLDAHFHLVGFIRKHYDKEHSLLRSANCIVFKSELLKLFEKGMAKLKNYDHLVACIELDKKYNIK